jgi:hypothetical protein
MKLYELTGVKKFYDKDVEDVLSSMSKTHDEAGRGHFGVTLKNSSKPEVVKFWIADSAYDDYVNYVAAHPYKHFPKLYSKPKQLSAFFLRSTKFPDKVRYVKMEALQKAGIQDALIISEIFSKLSGCNNKLAVENYTKMYLREPNKDFDESHLARLDEMVSNVGEFCQEMFEMLHAVLKGSNHLDVHSGNIMLRSNGELVITDPIYNSDSYDEAENIKRSLYRVKRAKDENLDTGDTVKGRSSSKPKGETK